MSAARRWLVVAPALMSAPAHAHDLSQRYGEFLGALLHPLLALDHAGAFLALGLLAGLRDARAAVVSFNVALFTGAILPSLLSVAIPFITTINVLSLLVLGVLVALALPLPLWLAVAIAGFFGMSHGLENGSDIAAGTVAWRPALGVLVAGIAITVPAAALVHSLPGGWPRIGVRVIGSWIAAMGLMILGLQFR